MSPALANVGATILGNATIVVPTDAVAKEAAQPRSTPVAPTGPLPAMATDLLARVCVPIQSPIDLSSIAAACHQEAPALQANYISTEVAVKSNSRVSIPTEQAQNVMMVKWGLQRQSLSHQTPTDANVFDEYQVIFGAPMSASKHEAIQALFPAGANLEEVVLVDGLELEDM
jgi:hypothetical protein